MKALFLSIFAVACGVAAPDAAADCKTLAPASAGSPASTKAGPINVDSAGADFCYHLDTRKLGRAHVMIDAPNASIALRLSKPDGTKIVDGWDVPVSSGSFENLEWSPPAGTELDVVLHVSLKSGAPQKNVSVSVSLFDPLE
jgi:hypothetical protein